MMKKLVPIITTALLIQFIVVNAKDNDCPHYSKVLNVYRRDKNAIDEYAKDFIQNNKEMFLYKQSYYGNNELNLQEYKPYDISDSGVIANAIFIYGNDTLHAKIGFLSKNNRTKIILISVDNYKESGTLDSFLKSVIEHLSDRYHHYLKTKNRDNKNW
jgi:hypothetical protein